MNTEKCWASLRKAVENYSSISDDTWADFMTIGKVKTLKSGALLLRAGQRAKYMYFIGRGLARTYYTDTNGDHYNKNIFSEGHFPASMVSLLEGNPSYFTIELLEDTTLIQINYEKYRQLIDEREDLKNFYISYMERRWVIAKEKNELAVMTQQATERYLTFLDQNPGIIDRVKQKHIAAHLGITPTQLSRIRRELKKTS